MFFHNKKAETPNPSLLKSQRLETFPISRAASRTGSIEDKTFDFGLGDHVMQGTGNMQIFFPQVRELSTMLHEPSEPIRCVITHQIN